MPPLIKKRGTIIKILLLICSILLPMVIIANPKPYINCKDYIRPVKMNDPQVLRFTIKQKDLVGRPPPDQRGSFVSIFMNLQNPTTGNIIKVRSQMIATNYYPADEKAAPNYSTDDLGKSKEFKFYENNGYYYSAHINFTFTNIMPIGAKVPVIDLKICKYHDIKR